LGLYGVKVEEIIGVKGNFVFLAKNVKAKKVFLAVWSES
jgi:hypothetical protein